MSRNITPESVSLSSYEPNGPAGVARCALGWLGHAFMGDAPAAQFDDQTLDRCHPATAGKYQAARTLFAKFIGLRNETSAGVREWAQCAGRSVVAEKLNAFLGLTDKLVAA